MRIADNLFRVPSVVVNTYLIVDPDGLTLIDCGLALHARRILSYVVRLGYTPQDIKRIVITHADGDHAGGLAAIKGASGATVYASRIEADAIAEGHPSRQLRGILKILESALWPLVRIAFRVQPVQVDRLVRDGDVLPCMGGLTVLETPGHTPGHISLFAPSTGVLFAGDSIAHQGGRLRTPYRSSSWDERIAAQSVKKQAALKPAVICPGHGPVILDERGDLPLSRIEDI